MLFNVYKIIFDEPKNVRHYKLHGNNGVEMHIDLWGPAKP